MNAIQKNYVAGEWVESAGVSHNVNPSNTQDIIGEYSKADRAQTLQAIAAAKAAFPKWSRSTPQERFDALNRISAEIITRKDELGRLLAREEGKTLPEGIGEVARAGQIFSFFAGEALRLTGEKGASVRPGLDVEITREAVGVIGLITPWNFPIAIPSWKGMAALICGNTVVIKPASQTPLSVVMLAEAFEEAGLPKGVWNVVTGGGKAVGEPMLRHPKVSVISFTGSTDVGRQISVACAPQFKHVHLEMGGKNVILVMDDADVDLAVDGALWGAFGTAGQRCTAASRIVAHSKVYDQFVEKLSARANKLRVGNGLDPQTDMGPNISADQIATIAKYVKIGSDEGATVTAGGATLTDGAYSKGHFHQPTVFANVKPDMRIAQEEIFGPVTAVMRCDSLEEAISIGNGVKYGLSSSIYTRDINKAFVAMRDMYTGIFYVNAPTIGAEVHLPFGGTKQTGNGHREAGIAGIDVFSEWKSIYVDYSGALQRAQIDTEEV
jgi:aldehyde dehydrogenase (NAD+)